MLSQRKHEIEQNFNAFQGLVASLLPEHFGEYALLRGRELVQVFPRVFDAMSEGHGRFADGLFSVQRVIDHPLDLGFLSYAEDERDPS